MEQSAGLLRRLAAFSIDMLLLAGVGYLLGLIAFDTLAVLGPWGRLIGLVLGAVYFGLLDGPLGRGQTLGKRLLQIAVCRLDGSPLTLPQSLGRFLLIWLPTLCNGLPLDIDKLGSPLSTLLSLGIFGLGGVLIYLAIIGRKSGRALQDLICASVVQRRAGQQPLSEETLQTQPLARKHQWVCALLVLLALLLPQAMSRLSAMPEYQQMTAIQGAVSALPGVRYTAVAVAQGGKGIVPGTVRVQVNVTARRLLGAEFMAQVLRSVLRVAPHAPVVQVMVFYGYDIGISNRQLAAVQQFVVAPTP